jgi:G3E family GTPase
MKSVSVVRTAVTCDAERLQLLLAAISAIAPQQVQDADVLLLNKIDLVDENKLAEAEATLRGLNADAPIYRICAKDGIDESVLAAVTGGN